LIALQNTDSRIRKLQAELDSIPQRRAEIEKEFDQRAFEFKALEAQRDDARAKRAQLEKEIAETRAKSEKAERDLMSSTDKKSYEAAIREVDSARKHISELETKVLEQMEAAEAAEKSVSEHDPEVERLRAERDEKLKAFEEQTRAQGEELEASRVERERLLAELPNQMNALYKRISTRIRDGVAVAEARKNSCSACFMSLRPEVMTKIRRGEEIIICDNCNRILYYVRAEQDAPNTASVSAS
jgi:predicted  nucleic acid-binding Zn-ribbon protein